MALSVDLRSRIIETYENEEGSIRELSERFKVGISTIWRLLKRYRRTGKIRADSPPGRVRKLDKAAMTLIEKLINQDNAITLQELCDVVAEQTELRVSLMSMHRACRRLDMN